MPHVSTRYLGLNLPSALVASASPLSYEIEGIRKLEGAGAGAVVLYSLFQEQTVPRTPRYGTRPWSALGAENFAVDPREFRRSPDAYVEHVAAAKRAVSVPIIASLNVYSADRWTEHARMMQQAGADALEIDVYTIETDPAVSGDDLDRRCVDVVAAARSAVSIPIAVKLSPFHAAPCHLAVRLAAAGANGLVLFNRFYQPLIDVERRTLLMQPVLSTSNDAMVPATWIALLCGRVEASLAASGGIHNGLDAIRAVLAGADAVMLCSALLQGGVEVLSAVRREMVQWMVDHDVASLEAIRGTVSLTRNAVAENFRRAGYAKVLNRAW